MSQHHIYGSSPYGERLAGYPMEWPMQVEAVSTAVQFPASQSNRKHYEIQRA